MSRKLSDTIHLWASVSWNVPKTNCGIRVERKVLNVLYASTAESLKIPPDRVCKTCYRLGPPWLVAVK